MKKNHRIGGLWGLWLLGAGPSTTQAQPWVVFEDADSGSICGVINTANAELVLLDETSELVIVSEEDLILGGTFVDDDLTVFVDGFESGFIDFFEDGDGLATLWWVFDATEEVVELDDQAFPFPSGLFPEDFIDVPCDACEFWDDPIDCEAIFDEDGDGVEDDFDLCPGTPLDEPVDDDGCSCLDFDSDADGVEDCFDQCARTPSSAVVDADGCPAGGGGGGDGIVVVGCGAPGAATLGLTLAAMMGLRFMRRGGMGRDTMGRDTMGRRNRQEAR